MKEDMRLVGGRNEEAEVERNSKKGKREAFCNPRFRVTVFFNDL